MKKIVRMLLVPLALAGCIAATGLGASAQQYYHGDGPRYAPPAAHYERHGPPPGRGYVWVGGYHRWNGNAYVWYPGGWQQPPQYGYIWHPGYWTPRSGIYIWIGGRWGPP